MFVDATTIPNGFVVDPMTFDVSPGTVMDLTVTCIPSALAPGVTTGSILLRGGTCDDSVTIDVTVTADNSRLMMSPDPVNAGVVVLGDEVLRTVTITNLGDRPRRIVSLTIQQGASAWRLVSDLTGVQVEPDAPVSVDVAFLPTAVGVDNAQLVLVDEDLCEATSSISLVGEGVDQPAHRLDVRIDEYTVDPYQRVRIPVWFDSDIRKAQPTAIDVIVGHSPLLLEVDEIVSTYPDADITVQWSRELITIEARSAGPDFGISGQIVEIRGRALPAIPDSTILDVRNVVVVAAEPVDWLDDDGMLRVHLCGPYNAIQHLKPPTVHLGAPHPVRDVLHLEFDAPFTQTVVIELVDPTGQVAASFANTTLPVGPSSVTLPVDQVSAGMYVVRVSTDKGGEFSLPVVLVR